MITDTSAKRRYDEDIIDGLHTSLPLLQAGAHRSIDRTADVRFGGLSEHVGTEVGEDRAGGNIGVGVGQILRGDCQRLIDTVASGGKDSRGDPLLQFVDLGGNGPVSGNAVVDRE